MNKEELKSKFLNYVNNFDMQDESINRKYNHSLRVMDISNNIARNLNLDKNDISLATIIGLLHDYGRFTQWSKYKTFSDIESVDHGDLGAYLLSEKELEKFYHNIEDYQIIYDSIKYHNKIVLPDNLADKTKLFAKIVRDADKLDILYLFSIKKDLFDEDDENISKEVEDDFYMNEPINYKNIRNKSDKILLNLALIFDLNFNYSFIYIKDNKLIEKIFESVINKEKYKKYFEYIIKYVNERIDKYVRYKI